MTTEYLQTVHKVLLNQWLRGQQQFHHKLARRFVYVHRVFHTLAICLFAVTVTVCIVHLQHPSSDDQSVIKTNASTTQENYGGVVAVAASDETGASAQSTDTAWRTGALLAILPAVLPAFLAALHGLSMQAEFERLAERSESMAEHLRQVADRFAKLTPSSVDNFGFAIGQRASEIALTMVEEVLDWRVIYLGHSTELT